jgi:phosphatidylserine/phosphatidylglycerophosphate/cardiolipin synthase-like enzyme
MSLSSDLASWFSSLESDKGLPWLHQPDILSLLAKTADFQAFNASLQKLPSEQLTLVLLRTLAAQKTTLSPRLIDADLVVTFPDSDSISARHTLNVVRQMISSAKLEILVAGFAITEAGGVLKQLAEASERGVRIILICSNWTDSKGMTAASLVAKLWPPAIARPRIYEYQNPAENTAGMHIKCMLVDGAEMLIGSANFTFPGLRTNFELGVRINGHIAESARDVFDEALRTSRFSEVKLAT